MTSLADGAGHPALRGLPAVWLRANCPCACCRDPGSGQRLVAVTDLPADVTVAGVLVSDGAVEVIFGPDGHRPPPRALTILTSQLIHAISMIVSLRTSVCSATVMTRRRSYRSRRIFAVYEVDTAQAGNCRISFAKWPIYSILWLLRTLYRLPPPPPPPFLNRALGFLF